MLKIDDTIDPLYLAIATAIAMAHTKEMEIKRMLIFFFDELHYA